MSKRKLTASERAALAANPPDYLTQREVARRIGLSVPRVRQLRAAGDFPQPFRPSGSPTGKLLFAASDIEAWLAARRRQAEREARQRRGPRLKVPRERNEAL